MPQLDDETTDQLRSGDAESFGILVRLYEESMLRVAFRLLGQHSDAEDVRQAVLVRIWEDPRKVPSASRLSAWIYRCVINESISRLRRRKSEQRRNERHAEVLSKSSDEPSPNEFEQLRQAMSKLTTEQRALLALKFDEQMTIREIGETMDIPHTTAQSRINKAVNELRKLLKPKSIIEGDNEKRII